LEITNAHARAIARRVDQFIGFAIQLRSNDNNDGGHVPDQVYDDRTLQVSFETGHAQALNYARSKIQDSIESCDLPHDINDPMQRAYQNGWNRATREARTAAIEAVSELS
jgi:hypothetical protein